MPTFRAATPADASDLAVLLDAASRRLVSWRWSTMADPGQSWFEVGRHRIQTLTSSQSHYSNWLVAEQQGVTVGALNGYRMPDPYDPGDISDLDPVFLPLVELEALAAGCYYIMVASVFAEHRGQGSGTLLLDKATDLARSQGLTRLALITESFNTGARRLYHRYGFTDAASRPFVPFPGANEAGDWMLMTKQI